MFAVLCELGAPAYASDGLCELAKHGTGAAAASEPELEQSGGGKTEPWESHSDDVAWQVQRHTEQGKRFVAIQVQPSFV